MRSELSRTTKLFHTELRQANQIGQKGQSLNIQTRFSRNLLKLDKKLRKKVAQNFINFLGRIFFTETLSQNFTLKMGNFGFFNR